MASTTRIPKAELKGVYGYAIKRFSKKMFGEVPEPAEVMWHNRAVLRDALGFGRKLQKWNRLDANLKSFAHMAVAALIGCSWCLDLNYFQTHNEGLDERKASEVPRWRESSVFTPLERDVMEYAEAMSVTPPTVTDELTDRLLAQLGAAAMVELTSIVAFANMSTRSNVALGIESQGFSKACALPLAQRTAGYVGEWLPEPLLTSPEVASDVELADSVSIAMLTVLETLGPTERAVFVLRDVFDTAYDEIAAAVGKSADAVRQIAHRARAHVAARRPRMQVSSAEQEEVVARFLAAVRSGDLQSLLDVLAPDVVLTADGGGLVAAARRPITGAEAVARFLSGAARTAGFEATSLWLNGARGALVRLDGQADTAVSLTVENGRITGIYAIRNPNKLSGLGGVAELTRT